MSAPFARRLFDAVDGMALDASTDPAPALGALDGLTLPQAEALAYWVETLRAVALVKSLELAAEAADRMRRAAADGK